MPDNLQENPLGTNALGEPRKPCKYCYEPIHPNAKRCPYCISWQHGTAHAGHLPYYLLPLILIPALVTVALPIVLDFSRTSRGPSQPTAPPQAFRNALALGSFSLSFNDGKAVALGTVTNNSGQAWENIELEAVFRDAEGNVVDTASERFYSAIAPGDSASFKIQSFASAPEASYDTVEVRLRYAELKR